MEGPNSPAFYIYFFIHTTRVSGVGASRKVRENTNSNE